MQRLARHASWVMAPHCKGGRAPPPQQLLGRSTSMLGLSKSQLKAAMSTKCKDRDS